MSIGTTIIRRARQLLFDNAASGLAAVNVQQMGDELAAGLARLGSPVGHGTYVVTGGRLLYNGSGFSYTITAGAGYINFQPVAWPQTVVTLAPSDPSDNRIDVFAVTLAAPNTAGVVTVITGSPAADPSKPDVDPATQLELTFTLVEANTTQPAGALTMPLYAENLGTVGGEWNGSSSTGSITLAGTADPRSGTKHIQAGAAPAGSTIRLVAAAPIDPQSWSTLALPLKITSAWNNNRGLTLQWYAGGVKRGNGLQVAPGQNGLSNANLTDYQVLVWQILEFGVPSGAQVDELRITVFGGAASFRLDDISLQALGGIGQPGAPGTRWLHGVGSPSAALGTDGDLYLDDTSDDYYQRTVGTWGAPIGSLKGAVGTTGDTGATGATGPAGPPGPRAVIMLLCSGYTPTVPGPDTAEVPVPYDSSDGTTAITFQVRRFTLRVGGAGGAPSVSLQKSTAAGAFTPTTLGTVALAAGDFEGSVTVALGSVQSGDKLRFSVAALGSAQNWTVGVELGT